MVPRDLARTSEQQLRNIDRHQEGSGEGLHDQKVRHDREVGHQRHSRDEGNSAAARSDETGVEYSSSNKVGTGNAVPHAGNEAG